MTYFAPITERYETLKSDNNTFITKIKQCTVRLSDRICWRKVSTAFLNPGDRTLGKSYVEVIFFAAIPFDKIKTRNPGVARDSGV